MPHISFELPDSNAVQVVDTENVKGVPVTILKLFGVTALHYHGKGVREAGYTYDNKEWEELIAMRISHFLEKMLMEDEFIAANWSEQSWTGREVRNANEYIHYVRDDI